MEAGRKSGFSNSGWVTTGRPAVRPANTLSAILTARNSPTTTQPTRLFGLITEAISTQRKAGSTLRSPVADELPSLGWIVGNTPTNCRPAHGAGRLHFPACWN